MSLDLAVPAETLRSLLGLLLKVVERRNTVPILSNVVIRAQADGALALMASDLDVWATATAPAGTATVTSAGGITLPAQLLSDLLRKLPKDASVRLSVDPDEFRASLKAGRSAFRLACLPVEDFPEEPAFGEARAVFETTPSSIERIVSQVGFAISTEETRYYLNGICLHGAGDGQERLTAVATDGHRLSLLSLPVAGSLEGLPRIIVPRKTVALLGHLAGLHGEDHCIRVEANETRIAVEVEGLRLVSRLIDGTFPDYERVIPRGNAQVARFDPAALAAAADRVATVSTDRGRAVAFEFAPGGALELVVVAPDAGEAREGLSFDGGGFEKDFEMRIGFNARYVADALATFGPAPIEMALHDAGSPALLRHPGDEDRLVVLMPMRI